MGIRARECNNATTARAGATIKGKPEGPDRRSSTGESGSAFSKAFKLKQVQCALREAFHRLRHFCGYPDGEGVQGVAAAML